MGAIFVAAASFLKTLKTYQYQWVV